MALEGEDLRRRLREASPSLSPSNLMHQLFVFEGAAAGDRPRMVKVCLHTSSPITARNCLSLYADGGAAMVKYNLLAMWLRYQKMLVEVRSEVVVKPYASAGLIHDEFGASTLKIQD